MKLSDETNISAKLIFYTATQIHMTKEDIKRQCSCKISWVTLLHSTLCVTVSQYIVFLLCQKSLNRQTFCEWILN